MKQAKKKRAQEAVEAPALELNSLIARRAFIPVHGAPVGQKVMPSSLFKVEKSDAIGVFKD
jgi:hypothetical protein